MSLVDIITKGDQSQNIFLYDGDIITLKKAPINQEEFNSIASSNIFPANINVNIIGSVNRPGNTSIKANETFDEVLDPEPEYSQWKKRDVM